MAFGLKLQLLQNLHRLDSSIKQGDNLLLSLFDSHIAIPTMRRRGKSRMIVLIRLVVPRPSNNPRGERVLPTDDKLERAARHLGTRLPATTFRKIRVLLRLEVPPLAAAEFDAVWPGPVLGEAVAGLLSGGIDGDPGVFRGSKVPAE